MYICKAKNTIFFRKGGKGEIETHIKNVIYSINDLLNKIGCIINITYSQAYACSHDQGPLLYMISFALYMGIMGQL